MNSISVKVRKYSYVKLSTQNRVSQDEWSHFPVRTGLALIFTDNGRTEGTFNQQNLSLQIMWKLELLDEIRLAEYMPVTLPGRVPTMEVVSKYPSIGIKCKNPATMQTVKKLQFGFDSIREFDLCLSSMRMWGIPLQSIDTPQQAYADPYASSLPRTYFDGYNNVQIPIYPSVPQNWSFSQSSQKFDDSGSQERSTSSSQRQSETSFNNIFPDSQELTVSCDMNSLASGQPSLISLSDELMADLPTKATSTSATVSEQLSAVERLTDEELLKAVEMAMKDDQFKALVSNAFLRARNPLTLYKVDRFEKKIEQQLGLIR